MHEDELARLRAEVDQAVAGMREFARAIGALYSGLLEEECFTHKQALQLTLAWVRGMAASGYSADE